MHASRGRIEGVLCAFAGSLCACLMLYSVGAWGRGSVSTGNPLRLCLPEPLVDPCSAPASM